MLRLFKSSSQSTLPAALVEEPAVYSAAEVLAHAEKTYKTAEGVKNEKDNSEETAYALRTLAYAVCASATQYGENMDVAQRTLGRISEKLVMLDAILADTNAKFGSARRLTVERRLLSLNALVSLLKMELKISLDGRRCGVIERAAQANAPGTPNQTHS